MKASISHIISFISMIVITLFISFVVFELSLRHSVIINSLDSINYYKESHETIIDKIDKNIVNDDIKEEYEDYISLDLVKTDTKKAVYDKDISLSHYKDFYNIIKKHSNDEKICETYAKLVDDIYLNNIFPVREYKLISKFYISTKRVLSYSLVMFSIIMILELGLYIINKNLKYNKISVLSSSILIMFPFTFILLTNYFTHFVYTNKYYTNLIIKLINNIKNPLYLIGLIVLFIIVFYDLLKKRSRK